MSLDLDGIERLVFAEITVVPNFDSSLPINSHHFFSNSKVAKHLEQSLISSDYGHEDVHLFLFTAIRKADFPKSERNSFCIDSG